MSMTDPIADLLTRIRNAQQRHMSAVRVRSSKLGERVLSVLMEEGYIRSFKEEDIRPGVKEIEVELKYYEGESAIREIKKISKPGRRVYAEVNALPTPYNGLGISILSTSKGVVSDHMARQLNVGGEVLCQVF
ncbi:MAG: 30S ribosomal protein S8 [Alphaproteobacteria bacterium]|nr:30S ribosomal protein S8 [Alphaproteobacteria bacterium]